MTVTRADKIAAVEQSPQAVATHDRRAWVDMFAAGARVEDPVGSAPHVGRVQIERFYDTFIGPRDMTFHRDVDVVTGPTVIRDLALEVAMTPHIALQIPIYMRYDLQPQDDGLKVTRLQAFWELPVMVGEFLRGGVHAIPASARLSAALLRNQGVKGTAGFLAGFHRVGRRAKRRFGQFLETACGGDEIGVRRGLAENATLTVGDDQPMTVKEFMDRINGGHPRKLIAAGHYVVAGLEYEGRRDIIIAAIAGVSSKLTSDSFTVERIHYFAEAR